ncbi:MAG: hypothetical protein QXX55_00620 [Candidatus Pacearchaeota archaeon]
MVKKVLPKEKNKEQKIMLSQEEFESKVLELGKKGLTAEKIGEELKKEGIHVKEHNKKISKILKERNLYIIPEIKNLEIKLKKLREHSQKNRQDKRAMRDAERIHSKLRKIKKYHRIID